ncbi:MAG: DNA-formamidopyrimidine glycosylase [Candidatus Omnitrophota bacterium]
MPELPEVETIKRDLEKVLLKKQITEVIVNNAKVIKEPSPPRFKELLKCAVCVNIIRRGKLLVLELKTKKANTWFLAIHLRMTGQVVYGVYDQKSRVSFKLSDGRFLNYNDQRILGELRVIKDWQALNIAINMGPEPLEAGFRIADFKERLKKRKTKIKPLLLDQSFVAGLGNIYAAEVLFLSGIGPARIASGLKPDEIKSLFENIKKVLKQAIKCRGTSFSDYRDGRGKSGNYLKQLFVYGRNGKDCLKCKTEIKRTVLGGRGTYYCSQCQK